MNKSLAVMGASQLVTLAGPGRPRIGAEMRELAIINDGAMLLRDGRIVQTGARGEIEKLIDADCEIVDAGWRIVMAGLVRADKDPGLGGHRADEIGMPGGGKGYQEIAAPGGGIRSTVLKTRAASEDEL